MSNVQDITREDIKYIHHLILNDNLKYREYLRGKKKFLLKMPILTGLFFFFSGFLKSLMEVKVQNTEKYKMDFILYSGSSNNYEVLNPIKKCLKSAEVVSFFDYGTIKLSRASAYMRSIVFLPKFFNQYFNAKGIVKEAYRLNFSSFLLTYGYYAFLDDFLEKRKDSIIFLANDHEYKARLFNLIAKKKKIKTVYIQHASISPFFPALDFDYAFLDGMDALEKYDSIGKSNTVVYLTGSPKYDNWIEHKNQNGRLANLGICTNKLDSIARVYDVIKSIKSEFKNLNIVLRFHPGDKRLNDWQNIVKELNIELNDSRSTPVFNFLQTVDAIISGESNIHLEAGIMNVTPIYYDFQDIKVYNDVYGFLKNNFCINSQSNQKILHDVLKNLINDRINKLPDLKYYFETTHTKFEGKSVDLIYKLINEIRKNEIDNSIWVKNNEIRNLTAYNLR